MPPAPTRILEVPAATCPITTAVAALALGVIVVYDAIATFIVINVVRMLVPLRMPPEHLEIGDEMVHGDVSLDLGVPRMGVEPPSVPVTHTLPVTP